MPESGLNFMQDLTPNRLQRAAASNHQYWMSRIARAARGQVHRENGATWIYTPGPSGGEVVIPFPRLTRSNASEQLDAILRYCRSCRSLQQVSCWSLDPAQPHDLGARLAARGFEWGWRPHWMWLDFQKMITDHPKPRGLRVERVEEEAIWNVEDLPYYRRDFAAYLHAATRSRPRRVWHFAAWLDGVPVGQSVLNLTTGRLGVAGIFNCGVVPEARNKGIGKAITLAACQFAQAIGFPGAVLNATGMGEPVYRRLGFESIGYGQTWWLHRETLESQPPTQAPVTTNFAEAVGRGDVDTLDALGKGMVPEVLDTPLANGMTLVQLAVTMSQPASAEWLVAHGATLDIISAWDVGWKDRVPHLLAESPEFANRRLGRWQITPLHIAAERGDIELARVLLTANPDLEIQDTEFHSTPLGWARHFQRTEIIALIQQHQAK